MKHNIKILNNISEFPSSLLIPKTALKQLTMIKKRFGNYRTFLHYCVTSKSALLAAYPRQNTGKINYQEKGQKLKRIDFRPFEGDWERFRLLAMTQKVSMTRLFVFLLLFIDLHKNSESGVQTKPPKIILHQSIICDNIFSYIQINRLIL